MLHYYVQRGWKIEDFLNQEPMNQLFYFASMQVALDEKKKMFLGGD